MKNVSEGSCCSIASAQIRAGSAERRAGPRHQLVEKSVRPGQAKSKAASSKEGKAFALSAKQDDDDAKKKKVGGGGTRASKKKSG